MLDVDCGDYDFVEGTEKLGAKQHLCCTESYLKAFPLMFFPTKSSIMYRNKSLESLQINHIIVLIVFSFQVHLCRRSTYGVKLDVTRVLIISLSTKSSTLDHLFFVYIPLGWTGC
jgi:hypothetical protein